MEKHSTFIGLDVHKDSIDIALADDGRDGVANISTATCPSASFTNCAQNIMAQG